MLTQDRRLEILNRFLMPSPEHITARSAACLLPYAQPLTRIHRLAVSDIIDDGGQMHIRFGDPPALVPGPLADLLRQLPRNQRSSWLFPGRLPGQPVSYRTLLEQISDLGLPLREARICALRQLVVQAPAPVVADALGFHQTTMARQVAHAGGTWNQYAAGRIPPSGGP